MIWSMIGGALGAALAVAAFIAGRLFERRQNGKKAGAGEPRIPRPPADPEAERRLRQWREWMRFLQYDGVAEDANRRDG